MKTLETQNFKLGKSGRAIKLLYNNEPFAFHTSTLQLPFGVNSITKEWSEHDEYSVETQLNKSSSDNAVIFRTFIDSLDNIIQKLVKENITFFSTNKINADPDFTYNTILRGNNINFPKSMKLILPRDRNGNFETIVCKNKTKDRIIFTTDNISEILCKKRTFKCIVECVKIWYYNNKVGSIWNITQMIYSENVETTEANANVNTNTNTNTNANANTNTNNFNKDINYNKILFNDND